MTSAPSTIVVGIGNTLMRDDGVGVWAVRGLAERFIFSPDVGLVEGGVLGLSLMDALGTADRLLAIDAFRGGGEPGTLYRLDAGRLPKGRRTLISLHEVGLAELLSVGELIGWRPRVRILGVQPLEFQTPGLELTPPLRAAMPRILRAAAEELSWMGVTATERSCPGSAGTPAFSSTI